MKNTKPYLIVNHLQFHFHKLLKETNKIDINNPANVCGLCLSIEYILRRLDIYNLKEGPASYLGWAVIIEAFKKIDAVEYSNLIQEISTIKNETEERELELAWKSFSVNEVFEKCVLYISNSTKITEIEKTLALLPPLPEEDTELLEASRMADYKWVKKLIDAGANPNIAEDGKWTPLNFAWYEYRRSFSPPASAKKTVLLLIKSGSNPDFGNNRNILDESIFPPEPQVFKALLEYNWDINYHTHEPIIYKLIKNTNPEESNTTQELEKNLKCLNYALKAKPNLNLPSTYLNILPICISYSQELSEKLISLGAKIELEAEKGLYYMTPLMKATFDGNLQDVMYWKEKGVNVNRRLRYSYPINKNEIAAGLTALDIANIRQQKKIKEYLIDSGGVTGEQISWIVEINKFNRKINPEDYQIKKLAYSKKIPESLNKLIDQIDLVMPKNAYKYNFIHDKSALSYNLNNLINKEKPFELTESYNKKEITKLCKDLENLDFKVAIK